MGDDHTSDKQDLVLELNFVPQWARKPPGENPYLHADGRDRDRDRRPRRRDSRDQRDRRGPPRPRGDRRQGGPRRDRRDQRDQRDRRGPSRSRGDQGDRGRSRPPSRRHEELPVDVHFIPEKMRIGAVAKKIHKSGRAYPLRDVAALFLGKAEFHLVKLEVRKGVDDFTFYQCHDCGMVFTNKHTAISHGLSEHLGLFYAKEEVEIDPPAGNYVCVGRCSLSGLLIGPPNYHGYNERVREVHEARFSHMPLDDYRRRIEMVHDAELVEQWKGEQCKKTVYHVRNGEEVSEDPMTWAEVEAHFHHHHQDRLILSKHRVLLDASVSRSLPNGSLMRIIRDAWVREEHYPRTLSLALRPAFRHMHLHLFKVGQGGTFVTSVRPQPIDENHTVETIKEVLAFLAAHPGCTRRDLAEGLRPDATPDSSEVAAVINPLRWLIERGHVIEFFDGTLSLPSRGTHVWSAKDRRSDKNRGRKRGRKQKA